VRVYSSWSTAYITEEAPDFELLIIFDEKFDLGVLNYFTAGFYISEYSLLIGVSLFDVNMPFVDGNSSPTVLSLFERASTKPYSF